MTIVGDRLRSIRHLPMTMLAHVRDLALRQHSPPLAICAILKNEAKNLGEWVAFHRSVGVGHFYLYDNGSTDNFRGSGRAHPGRIGHLHRVARISRTGFGVSGLHQTLLRAGPWVAFVDIDEFLFSPQQRDVAAVLERFRDCPGLFIHSYHFGSSGHQRTARRCRRSKPTRDARQSRRAAETGSPTRVGSGGFRNPHLFRYWGWGHQTPNTERQVADPDGECRPVDVLRINHYWSRSYSPIWRRKLREPILSQREVSADHYRRREQSYNTIEDRTIIELVAATARVESRSNDRNWTQARRLEKANRPAPVCSVAAVIPLYNGGRHIEAALRSVLAQTVLPDEIIVVNDGSTDDGAAVVARFALSHPITILTKPNGGQSSARNMGVAHAKSDLIAFLDQDDIWYPTHVAELSRRFENDERAGVVYSNIDEIDDAGDLQIRGVHSQPDRSIPNPISRNACERTCTYSRPRPSYAGRRSRRLAGLSTSG